MVVVADNGLNLELQLQVLPCSPASLAFSPVLRQGQRGFHCAELLTKFSAQACSFNRKECAGPISILFSSDLEKSADLLSDSATAHKYCQELLKLYRTVN
jgi:hypothetical protein